MSSLGGPSIVTSGLVLHLDAANVKSFKGEPTVNLVAGGGLVGMSGITLALISTDGVWKKYSMSGTFSGGTYPYIMYVTTNLFTGGLPYSTKCTILTNALYKFNYFGTGINYVNQPMTNNGVMLSIMNSDDSRTVSRSGFIYTSTTSQTGYLLTNPINGIGFSPSTDFVWIKDLQVEQLSYTTPYVNGTRGTSVETGGGLADRSGSGNNAQILNGPTYNSLNGGSIVFDGTNDYISIPNNTLLNSNSTPFTVEICIKLPSSVPAASQYLYTKLNNSFVLYLYNNLLYMGKDIVNDWATVSITSYLSKVLHITAGWDGTNKFCYFNGVSVVNSIQSTNLIQSTVNNLYIGGIGTVSFNGSVYFVRNYSRALSTTEVLQNYDATKSRFI